MIQKENNAPIDRVTSSVKYSGLSTDPALPPKNTASFRESISVQLWKPRAEMSEVVAKVEFVAIADELSIFGCTHKDASTSKRWKSFRGTETILSPPKSNKCL